MRQITKKGCLRIGQPILSIGLSSLSREHCYQFGYHPFDRPSTSVNPIYISWSMKFHASKSTHCSKIFQESPKNMVPSGNLELPLNMAIYSGVFP